MTNNKKLKQAFAWFLIILMTFVETGCRFYRVTKTDYSAEGEMVPSNLIKYDVNFYFVHVDNKVIQLDNVIFSSDNETIMGEEVELDKSALKEYERVSDGIGIGDKGKTKNYDIKQLHFFVSKLSDEKNGLISFKKGNVSETKLMKNAIILNFVGDVALVIVGGALIVGAVFLIGVIVFALICNCPHVYTSDGTNYIRNSNAFVGSVSKVLEKEDVAVVNFGDGGQLNVNILNEDEQETQFINEAKLIQVIHDKDVQILPDQNGNLYTLSDKKVALNGEIKGLSEKGDNLSYEFEVISKSSDLSELELTFPIAKGKDKAKLVLTAKNTFWASYVMQEWYKLFGADIDKIKAKNANRGAEEQLNWQKDQGISLSVFVKSNGEWVFQEAIGVVGNTVSRDIIVPLSNLNENSDILEVKLVSGYKLWDVDYAAVDYSDESEIEVKEIAPNISNLTNNTFNKDQISQKDESYTTLNYGDTLSLSFNGEIGEDGKEITHLLKLSGYYIEESNQTGELKRRELASFRHKAQMSRYSFHLMKNLNEGLVLK